MATAAASDEMWMLIGEKIARSNIKMQKKYFITSLHIKYYNKYHYIY